MWCVDWLTVAHIRFRTRSFFWWGSRNLQAACRLNPCITFPQTTSIGRFSAPTARCEPAVSTGGSASLAHIIPSKYCASFLRCHLCWVSALHFVFLFFQCTAWLTEQGLSEHPDLQERRLFDMDSEAFTSTPTAAVLWEGIIISSCVGPPWSPRYDG